MCSRNVYVFEEKFSLAAVRRGEGHSNACGENAHTSRSPFCRLQNVNSEPKQISRQVKSFRARESMNN